MHIVTRARLLEFAKNYPDTKTGLDIWYRKVKRTNYNNFNELRLMFPSAEQVGTCRFTKVFSQNNHLVYN